MPPHVAQHGPHALINDIPVSLCSHEQVLMAIDSSIARGERGQCISITNTESMYHALRNKAHGDYVKEVAFSLCDGVGMIPAGLAWGHRIRRFNGPILQLKCSEYGVTRGWRHFYYGGKLGVGGELAKRMRAAFPGLIVSGVYEPPFRPLTDEEKAAVVRQINEAKPHFVWVGLGLLKQEAWIAEFRDQLDANWLVGVGAAFDYHSGAIPWAPGLIRALGLEWLFRLVIQPKLRAKRYWWSAVFAGQSFLGGLIRGRFLRPQRVGSFRAQDSKPDLMGVGR